MHVWHTLYSVHKDIYWNNYEQLSWWYYIQCWPHSHWHLSMIYLSICKPISASILYTCMIGLRTYISHCSCMTWYYNIKAHYYIATVWTGRSKLSRLFKLINQRATVHYSHKNVTIICCGIIQCDNIWKSCWYWLLWVFLWNDLASASDVDKNVLDLSTRHVQLSFKLFSSFCIQIWSQITAVWWAGFQVICLRNDWPALIKDLIICHHGLWTFFKMANKLERKMELPGVETGAYELVCQCSGGGTVAQWQSTGMVSHRHWVQLPEVPPFLPALAPF